MHSSIPLIRFGCNPTSFPTLIGSTVTLVPLFGSTSVGFSGILRILGISGNLWTANFQLVQLGPRSATDSGKKKRRHTEQASSKEVAVAACSARTASVANPNSSPGAVSSEVLFHGRIQKTFPWRVLSFLWSLL